MQVTAEVDGLIAVTTTDLIFRNPSDRPQEATLLFPIPSGVSITDFTLTVDGTTREGEILDRDEAARIYTGIVQRQRDPALLEYVGSDVLRARVFPVPARGESRLTLRFTRLLRPENGALRYRLPLNAGPDSAPALSSLTINVRVQNLAGVGSLFSPTHALRFDRVSVTAINGSFEARNVPPRGAFELNILPGGEPVPAGLVTYRGTGADGFFMLWLAPPLREDAVVDKDVILVIDVSGSMAGRKFEQAKAALRFVLGRLNPGDRFNIVPFSSSVSRYASELRPAADAPQGIAYVDRLRAEGSTNINDALLSGMRFVQPGRPATLLFLTDGLPTVGEQNRTRILDNVRDAAPANARLFVFGVGNDVDTTLLDSLATQNRGDVQYVLPADDVEETVSTLYARISAPQLTDVHVDFGAADVHDVFPQPLPDLFGGQTLFLFGRYRNAGSTTIRLSGTTRKGPQSYTYAEIAFAAESRDASYIPALWAGRKVAVLLREVRLRGAERSRELIDEIVALSTRYGIVTPYTAFLVQEPSVLSPQAAANRVAQAAEAPSSGSTATMNAQQTGQIAQAAPMPRPATSPSATARPATPVPAPARTPVAPTVAPAGPGLPPSVAAPPPAPPPPSGPAVLEQRFVADKSFVLRAGIWTDSALQPEMETLKVAFGSDGYFALLAEKPALAQFFALGERVLVVLDGVAYEVTGG